MTLHQSFDRMDDSVESYKACEIQENEGTFSSIRFPASYDPFSVKFCVALKQNHKKA